MPQFEGTPLTISNSIGIVGVDIMNTVQFRGHLEGKIKLDSKNLGVLNQPKQYFTLWLQLVLYKAEVRPYMEYCSHLSARAPPYQADPLDAIQRLSSI